MAATDELNAKFQAVECGGLRYTPMKIFRMLALVSLFAWLGCKDYAPQVIHITEDCISKERPAIEALIKKWADNHFSISAIVSDALASGVHIGGCAFSEFINGKLTPPPGTAALSPDETWTLEAAVDEYRMKAKIYDNVTFKTPKGNL